MAFLMSLLMLLAAAFGGFHMAAASRSSHAVPHAVHASQHGFTPSGSGPVGGPQP